MSFVVHKFGGTSVGNASSITNVIDIVTSLECPKIAVVVSAIGGVPKVTDLLIQLVDCAQADKQEEIEAILITLRTKHEDILITLLPPEIATRLMQDINDDILQLSELLRAITIMRSFTETIMEFIAGHGEIWSAKILTEILNQSSKSHHRYEYIDARRFLTVEIDSDHGPVVQYELSEEKLNSLLQHSDGAGLMDHIVITGFICNTVDGIMTTLKRDGSDFTASICGRLLHASSITIWTDVSGVLSADPRRVPESKILNEISYQEAMELAYFGAKVIHPKTMTPAIMESIPIYIRNTFHPTHLGTKITHGREKKEDRPRSRSQVARHTVSGFSTVDHLALFNIEGAGMIGVHGTSSRLFSALDRSKVNVVLIAQASSEHSICFAVPAKCAKEVKNAVSEAFFKEIHHGLLNEPEFVSPVSVIAAVGDNMTQTPGVSGRFFSALGRAGINTLAISQGSSERNTSAVVRYEDSAAALRAAHSAFFLSDQTISIGVMGLDLECDLEGGIGNALLEQYYQQRKHLKAISNVDIRIRAVTTTDYRMFLCSSESITAEMLQASSQYEAFDHAKFLKHVCADHIPHWLLVDVSRHHASHIPDFYSLWLDAGVHVVSANINVAAYPSKLHQELKEKMAAREVVFDTEACLAIGVPLVGTIRNFIETGDSVERVELSATQFLTDFLLSNDHSSVEKTLQLFQQQFEHYRSRMRADEIMQDISGILCAKKAILLARELDVRLDLSQVEIDPCLMEVSPPFEVDTAVRSYEQVYEHFRAKMKASCMLQKRLEQAHLEKETLGVIVCIDVALKQIKIQVASIDRKQSMHSLESGQCGISFFTRRHATHPIVITGPVADAAITAGCLFGSILNLAHHLGKY
uniref:Uncharacterized protein ALNC14_049080 n=1 Tax=Albugo laibachii Nc14 TaxID=890382 RepID=F0WC52_9STRA|nr:unnamed protein product [Albugo laibachii Nc14]CCA25199.1 unnamed protein product [Albugo laibachii Nc14]|eukprot:CCA25199.1 unnamed protein product [Albugo laibachii Nc14]